MKCPFCGNNDTQVKDSRATEDNSAIRRRRFCSACGARFTTFERIQLRELTVLKKSGKKVAVVVVSSLSNRMFTDKIEPHQEKIHSQKDDEWNSS